MLMATGCGKFLDTGRMFNNIKEEGESPDQLLGDGCDNTLLGENTLLEFKEKSGDSFILCYQNDSDEFLFEIGQKSRLEVEEFFEDKLTSFKVYVLTNGEQYNSYFKKHNPEIEWQPWIVGNAHRDGIVLLSPSKWGEDKDKSAEGIQQLVSHELTHLYHNVTYSKESPEKAMSENQMLWALEGLAETVSGVCQESYVIQYYLDHFPVNQLTDLFPPDMEGPRSPSVYPSYALSASFVRYLKETKGAALLRDLVKIGTNEDFLTMIDMDQTTIVDDWKKSIQSEQINCI